MEEEISTPCIFNKKILQDAVCPRSVHLPYIQYHLHNINPNKHAPSSKTALNTISDHFPTLSVTSTFFFAMLDIHSFILDPQIVQ
jgi:hypothetical protein